MWREAFRASRSSSLEQSLESSMENKAYEDVDLEDQTADKPGTSKAGEAAIENNVRDIEETAFQTTADDANRVEAQNIEEHDGPYAGMGKDVLLRYSQAPKWRISRWFCVFLLVAGWFVMLAMAIYIIVTTPRCLPWWQLSTIYQIYPRSFRDSNGDGIGDLQGIIQEADYLSRLGIGAVLLNSIFKDGGKDFGYDVTDFQGVDEDLGTLQDFEDLLAELHGRDIKVILDFIPNHSSDQHEWFLASRDPGHEDSNFYTYYLWNDASDNPNNWVSLYSGDAWSRDDLRQEYYLHQYSMYQPDLNYANEAVYILLTDALDYWFTLGVDGFNLHAMNYIYEDPDLRDEPPNPDFVENPGEERQYDSLLHYYTNEYGNNHQLLRDWRKGVFDQYSTTGTYRIMLTDSTSNSSHVRTYYGTAKQPEAEIPQNFNLAKLGDPLGKGAPTTGNMVKEMIDDWMVDLPEKKWPNFVMGNHEVHRVASRLGPLYAAAANMLILTLPGTPICYYGDEIGMEDIVMTADTVLDIRATNDIVNWESKTRDPERSPMQWSREINAGFSESEDGTWLPVNENYMDGKNVEEMESTEGSILQMFKSLVYLRKSQLGFENANIHHVHSDEEVVSYIRETPDMTGKRYFIAINFGMAESEVDYFDMDETIPIQGTVVVGTDRNREITRGGRVEMNKLFLAAGEGLVIELDKVVEVPAASSFLYKYFMTS